MKSVLINSVFILFAFYSLAQVSSEKLKRDQARLERKIADTKLLLEKSKSQTESSFNELRVIENQISYREQLLRNYNNQIRSAELNVERKEKQIGELADKIERLKSQYKRLLLYAYKHRNKYGKMMYIFSAESYYEAVKRNKYLERIREIQQKQFILIKQHQELMRSEIEAIKKEKEKKLAMIEEKKKERKKIEADKIRQQEIYQKFKAEEEEILAKLKKEERDRQVLKERINQAIKREIELAEAARRKREAEAAKSSGSKPAEPISSSPSFTSTKEEALVSRNFEGNRGRLPWPVDKGTITENFGKNAHPTLKNVYTNNRGVDISTPKNAQVRTVFDGEVTSVLNIPGAGKVVIIKHGNYRTVYSNLQETYVKTGDRIKTKQLIGSLLVQSKQNNSIAHFEIHKVSGSSVVCLNPSLWIVQ
jgi:septal ring factor EnvC (AmiA/AmiB activator)